MSKLQLTGSIVIYNESPEVLLNTVAAFLAIPMTKRLFIIDNSEKSMDFWIESPEVHYRKAKENLGFGRGHNLVLDEIKELSHYHLVLNPDVTFKAEIFKELCEKLESNNSLAMISPRVIYENGDLQYTCRKDPTIKEMISRRLGIFKSYTEERAYCTQNLEKPFFPSFIHGCFFLFKTREFVTLSGFDTRYFLYLEDADICREIRKSGKKLMYYPMVEITHIHRKGSAKKLKLLGYHIVSAFRYFRKWGLRNDS